MLNLARADSQRATKKAEIIAQIESLRQTKIAQEAAEAERRRKEEEEKKQREAREEAEKQAKIQSAKTLLTSAQTVLDKTAATKEEVEKALQDLKTLSTATSDSPEAQV
jgi:Cdc6-like AAA superfamily ATPase